MKFRVISDLHIDVNHKYPFELKDDDANENIITLVAGDVSGDPELDYKWLTENTNYHGFVISGNHIVYNNHSKTIQDLQQMERDLFSKSDRWVYLEKDYKVFDDDKVIIFGATLWTDYEIGPSKEWNMCKVIRGMNDFRFGFVRLEDGSLDNLMPDWCIKEHQKTLEKLDEICKQYPDYSIIVVTHHCPGIKSISHRYWGNDCNAAYCSDLSEFIKNHNNIKVWCCGHVHHVHTYNVEQCKVLCNPHGYVPYAENNGWNQNILNFELENGEVKMLYNPEEDAKKAFDEKTFKKLPFIDNNF